MYLCITVYQQRLYLSRLFTDIFVADFENICYALVEVVELTVGEKIKKARLGIPMTQEEVAKCSGISASTIRKYESGRLNPKIETLKKLALAIGINLRDLLPDEFSPDLNHEVDFINWQLGYDERTDEFQKEVNFACEELKRRKEDTLYSRLLAAYNALNAAGQEKAAERVEELTEIPKYQKSPDEK